MALNMDQLAAGITLAYALLDQGRYKDTETLVAGLLTFNPEDSYLHSVLASAMDKQGKLDEAVQEYDRAIQLNANHISALVNRGEIHIKQGRFKEAASDLNRAIELDSNRESPSASRARLLVDMTAAALKLANEKGLEAVPAAQEEILKQLDRSRSKG